LKVGSRLGLLAYIMFILFLSIVAYTDQQWGNGFQPSRFGAACTLDKSENSEDSDLGSDFDIGGGLRQFPRG